jgi:hypothetical protein
MNKIKEWLNDKWSWLKTFNNPPTIRIKAKSIFMYNADGHVITIDGRANLSIDGGELIIYDRRTGITHTIKAEIEVL